MLSRWLMVAALRLLVVSGETSLPSSQFKTLPYSTIQADLEELAANYPHLAKASAVVGGLPAHEWWW